ncbi:XRE family transcriptional regulator [Hydrogenophaga sp. 5NK40-0174]|uniref:helix-turn-helix transcriptional regulator n=1 Tax=Hydrogenophaga sp. 5NK40-0174 TaxID=3127649 RepID=UPI00310AB1A1
MPKQNISPSEYPEAVRQEIERLGQNIVLARKRRRETQAQWARKLGVSLPTMARIERGDPSVSMASYAMCLWLIRPEMGLADLAAPERDTEALEREVAKVRQSLRKSLRRSAVGALPPNPYAPLAAEEEVGYSPSSKVNPAAAGLADLMGKPPTQLKADRS